jgi:hypothetical protein
MGEHDVQPVDRLGAGLDQVLAVLDDRAQRGHRGIHPGCAQPLRGQCGHPNRGGVGGIALAAMSGGEQSYPRRQLRRDIHYFHTVIAQTVRQRRSQAGGTFDRPVGVRPFSGESAQLSVTVVADRHPNPGQQLQRSVDRCCGR